MNDKPDDRSPPPPAPRSRWMWLWLAKPVDDVRESWYRSRAAGVLALFLLVVIPVMAFVIYGKELVHLVTGEPMERSIEHVSGGVGRIEAGHSRLHRDVSRVAESLEDSRLGVELVREQVGTLKDEMQALALSLRQRGEALVSIPAEPSALGVPAQQAGAVGAASVAAAASRLAAGLSQPVLGLFYYDGANALRRLDDSAPELHGGQYLKIFIANPAAASADEQPPLHEYLLAIEGDGAAHLFTRQEVDAADGDWLIGRDGDCETLLVLGADHELTDAEREALEARLSRGLDRPAIRPNVQYVWMNGDILPWERQTATRDLRRNPDAALDWASTVNRTLFESGFTYHGFTYPVANTTPEDFAP